jgi:hypothetical protein
LVMKHNWNFFFKDCETRIVHEVFKKRF